MPFLLASLVKKASAAAPKPKSRSARANTLLERYAEFDIDAQHVARGERGIVVLSLDGEAPILTAMEEYCTGASVGTAKRDAGLAGTARRHAAEEKQLAALAAGRSVSYDVLFDAESLEHKGAFVG